ncbi:ribosomal protein L22/L17 [Podospora australis]|uniref:Ribosomal protein L22/L17 n=1 Tax=Podospora australis TaxID=1536484 RepID=A0AAN7AJP3_9PEZI|nr:ribosomal protein L22/L17 [Podospora australis]
MSLSMPSRRLIRGAPIPSTTTTAAVTSLLPALQSLTLTPPSSRRSLSTTPSQQWFWNKKQSKKDLETPLEAQASSSRHARQDLMNRLANRIEAPSIFEDEVAPTLKAEQSQQSAAQQKALAKKNRKHFTEAGASLAKSLLARSVDPDPRSRVRWERKMLIRQIHNGTNPYSTEPRDLRIKRTERQLLSKSPWLATSVKKLVKLAHQIQGKSVSEALVQMRYSKKKMAKEVKFQLEQARDLAIVERGMGLGEAQGTILPDEEAIKIQNKDGKWLKINDPTKMYVAEAWVNRGPWRSFQADYVSRGRIFRKQKPSTSISVVLKEEKTRIRQHEEREHRKKKQGPWVHLPDRPISAQRPHYSW